LVAQVVRHLGTRGFIFWEQVVAESFAGVKGDGQVIRALLLQDAQQDAGEAIYSGGWLAAVGGETGGGAACQGVVCTVGQSVTVKQVNCGRHGSLRPGRGEGLGSSLVMAGLLDEFADHVGGRRLRAAHDQVARRPKVTRWILARHVWKICKDALGSLLAQDAIR
jgi:hypothetical protein